MVKLMRSSLQRKDELRPWVGARDELDHHDTTGLDWDELWLDFGRQNSCGM